MSTQLVTVKDTAIMDAIARICNHPDFKTIIDGWREKLQEMYSEACAQPEHHGRDWYAGRAALMEQFLKRYDDIKANGVPRQVEFKANPNRAQTLVDPAIRARY